MFAGGESSARPVPADLVGWTLHFEWSGSPGMRPDPSGKPAFRPLAMHW
jgi:hypothetical protein